MPMSVNRWAAGVLVASAVAALVAPHLHARDDGPVTWVDAASLVSPQLIEDATAMAQKNGAKTLLVRVREHGDSYFLNGLEPRPMALLSLPAFDPLAAIIASAHARGLAVHAWINVNLIAGTDVPLERGHVVYRHPEWLMVPRDIADELARLDMEGPEYLGRLTRYARSRPAEIEGLYLSPVTQAAVDYTTSVVRDIVTRYAVDGVYFDYLRYPGDDFDYSREALRAFGQSVTQFPDRWRRFRADRLTALLDALRAAVKTARPTAVVSVAVPADPVVAFTRYLQDWSGWMKKGLLDTTFSAPF